jgi:hypothetical protein
MSRNQLRHDVQKARADEDPHEREVPLQRAAEPAAECQRFWNGIDQPSQ